MSIVFYQELKKKAKAFVTQVNGIKYLSQVNKRLLDKGIVSFADFGTLLGIIRENHLLKNDFDVDVGVLASSEDVFKIVDQTLIDMGYRKYKEVTIDGEIKKQAYWKKHINMDIEYYFEDSDDNLMYCYLFYAPPHTEDRSYRKCVIKKCPKVTKTKEIIIKNKPVFIPENSEEILVYKYGENWRIPDGGWVYWEGPNTYPSDKIGKKSPSN